MSDPTELSAPVARRDRRSFEARWLRKHPLGDHHPNATWWAPRSRGWWIALLFAIGSILFALGALPAYASTVGTTPTAITFFVGSIFFTSAATLQYRESVDDLGEAYDEAGRDGRRRRWFVWEPHHLGWSASAVQLAGTLWFNLSTGYAIHTNLSASAANARVWRPDALGSIAFLAASTIAWVEVCHGWWAWRPRSLSWQITVANLIGSIAFGASAAASYVIPTTDSLRNVELSNLGTFVGALCFLVGAVLLMPERVAAPESVSA